jgi:outer membrane cobalamin receptor
VALRKKRTSRASLQSPLAFVIFILLTCSLGTAQQITPPDSLSLLQPDSLRAPRYKSRFIPFIGNLARVPDSTSLLHSSQFIQTDAASVADLLMKVPGIYIRDLGQPGQPSELNMDGINGHAIGLLLDGRPLRDPVTGSYNLYDLPIEFLDVVEIANNSASLFAAPNANGGAMNLVSHQYDNGRPTTKLRFLQGPFNHILTDGLFAQNIARGVNAMFGFQRLVTDGRYSNSQYDSWSIRARLRYNITERINVWASDFYNKSTTGLNGGIDPINSPTLFDEVTAVVRDESTVQTIARHDFTLGLAGKFLPDTTSKTRALVYYSFIDREYSTGASLYTVPTFSDIQRSSFWGAKVEQQVDLSPIDIEIGAEYERRETEKGFFLPGHLETYASAKGRAALQPMEWLTVEGSARYENLRDDGGLSWSARLQTSLTDGISAWGTISRSFRYPTIQELYWTDSTLTRTGLPGKETHSRLEFGVRLKTNPLSISLKGYKRKIDNAVVVTQKGNLDAGANQLLMFFPQVDVQGAAADLSIQLWRLTLVGNLAYTDYQQQINSTQPFPRFSSYGEMSYSDEFGNHVVDLKVAVRLKAMSHHFGLQFIPEQYSFVQQNAALTPGYSTLDLYTVVKIGDAHVMLVWENPLNVKGMMAPYYPLLGRNIKLGVNWVFTD